MPVDVILKDIIFHHMICYELSAPGRNICLGLTVGGLLVIIQFSKCVMKTDKESVRKSEGITKMNNKYDNLRDKYTFRKK